MIRQQLKPGQLWQDVDRESQQTRIRVHQYAEWWMSEARENYEKLERARALLTNPEIKRSHAIDQINKAMRRCYNANNEVQFNMRALSRLNTPKVDSTQAA